MRKPTGKTAKPSPPRPRPEEAPPSETALVPALTILAHTDPSRVGERLVLPALAAGLAVRLSRQEPVFNAPAGSRDTARPLQERHLSRSPMRLTGGDEPGSVTIDRGEARTSLIADGETVERQRTFSPTEVGRGVVLVLARRLVLLLHRMPTPIPEDDADYGLLGESFGIVALRRQIRRLAPLDVPVLLCGATGTGKELTARALHDAGARPEGPFIAVNMATLPPALAAAELFGAVRGAYTGAERNKIGLFRQAQGGTLFLDEIGETPNEIQPMLLRALENHEIRPVGAAESLRIDVRVIAATDTDLDAAIAAGNFRAPLYHRLAGYAVRLPSLAERRDDIGRLFAHFLAEEHQKLDGSGQAGETGGPPAEIIARLARHDWPGNVRELRNVVRRLLITGYDAAPELLAAQVEEMFAVSAPPPGVPAPLLPPPALAPESSSEKIPKRRRLRKPSDVSEEELLSTLEANHFKLQPTADALGLSRINLYRLIEKTPAVRKAADLKAGEIKEALAGCHGNLEAAAAELRVSLPGLKRQISTLGIED